MGRGMGWDGTRFSGPCGTAVGRKFSNQCQKADDKKYGKLKTIFMAFAVFALKQKHDIYTRQVKIIPYRIEFE